ncbi:MAG: hypothetical protein HETSPECPRED_001033 [Heterodermia speciosa]|uniref:Uncharacterized protein n=1 Tax=Heterodermia speciosa TaxID=116794 RepID=A0A8H3J0E4_9LECA|nr:MAG: hypothetical protein HETSPECPRED_001033 [Heterodermia speciosa]
MRPKRRPRRQPNRGAAGNDAPDGGSLDQPVSQEASPQALASHDVPNESEQLSMADSTSEMPLEHTENSLPYEDVNRDPIQSALETSQSSDPRSQASERPARRPAQRLASLRNPSPTGGREGMQRTYTGTTAGVRFQPKSVQRRSKEEREAAEQAENERLQARLFGSKGSEDVERGDLMSRKKGRGMFRGIDDRFSGAGASGHLGGSTRQDRSTRRARGPGGLGPRGRGGDGGGESRGRGHGAVRGGIMTTGVGFSQSDAAREPVNTRRKKDSTVKTETDKDGDVVMNKAKSKKKIKKEPGLTDDTSSSESEYDGEKGRRINIEEIDLVSTDEDGGDEDLDSNRKERATLLKVWNPKPVRFHREEHVERAVGVNTDPTTLTSAELRRRAKERQNAQGSIFLGSGDDAIVSTTKAKGRGKTKDVEFIENKRKWKGVYQDDDDTEGFAKVKTEPNDDDAMIMNESDQGPTAQLAGETPSLNVQGAEHEIRAAAKEIELTDSSDSSDLPNEDPLSGQNRQGKTTQPHSPALLPKGPRRKHRPPKPILQTDEDHQEWARYKEDMTWMQDTLLQAGGTITSQFGMKDLDQDDMDMDIVTIGPNSKANHIFLFQFPPGLPILVDALAKEQEGIKTEKKNDGHQLSAQPTSSSTATEVPVPTEIPPPTNPNKKPPAATKQAKSKTSAAKEKGKDKDKEKDKEKDDNENLASSSPQPPPPQIYTPLSPPPPPGHFGTLRLHRSKRVTANWGTLQFDIGRSSERLVSQEIVVCDWNKTVVKKEGFEGLNVVGSSSGDKIKGEEREGGVKAEERGEWREEVRCGERVWAVGGVKAGWVGVPDLGAMFGT